MGLKDYAAGYDPAQEDEDEDVVNGMREMFELLEQDENDTIPGSDMEVTERGQEEPGVSIEELRSIVKFQCREAVDYAEEELARRRMLRLEAYEGLGLSTDDQLDETRSKVVSRDVHDTVHKILPSIMRIFCGSGSPVEYNPVGIEDIGFAKQATDYVNDIVLKVDNDFYSVMYSASHDALVKGLGVFKWWWEQSTKVEGSYYSGLDQTSFQMLASQADVEIDEYEEVMTEVGPAISCHAKRTVKYNGKVKVEAVPPEERLISKDARSIEDAVFYGHRRLMTVSDLVALGFSYDQVVRFGGSENLETNEEAVERYDNQVFNESTSPGDPSLRELEVVECYLKVDLDGDGIAEMYRIFCGGQSYTILEWDDGDLAVDLCDEVNFAELCPDPVPHKATGNATSDKVMDVQDVKTNLLRGTLDSLSRAIFPREEIVEGQVNIDDAMNPEIGAMVRVRAPGMIREIVTPFMGKECLPVLGYMDEVKADRTGISDATMGLNPQQLQSSTEGAVTNTISAAQTQIEMISRHFSNGVRKLFSGILGTIKQNQDKARVVRLRNTWHEVDPAAWNVSMDASPAVALGRGTEQDRIQYLTIIAQKQEAALQQMGPQNGLCTLAEYRNTLAEIVKASGYFHADQFFLPVEQGAQVQQLAEQNKKLTGELEQAQQQAGFMQAELMKRSASAANKDDAAAEKSRAGAFKESVSAIHEAGTALVEGAAVVDEMALHQVITSKPQGQGQ